ncbi:hypothetical protein COEREDRAFT_10101 [Coemansia reversa NRRL 1564]|uniref:DOMON domain-containing protein n=1 Tax=Coemansia reversa (strain ATCC 12441 / NRRL 1564) TaxID=763665 RepID=A0A2G5B6Q3_COERN|nr:hypothetical protein COEREDRAFT_10101 [Coemansia reversa NRRL 1564]|eukprot:PIA14674.1 hypothetical protein COEREDRAFT_10101 [Coemansia reversa NRRL 1564]
MTQQFDWRPRSWHSSALLLLAILYLLAFDMALCADDQPTTINPLGITFDYRLAWVDVEESSFGVSLQATAQSTHTKDVDWSLLIRFAPDAQANITAISSGWGLGIYDYASWAILPGREPFGILRFTVRSSGQMSSENMVVKLAEPVKLILVPNSVPSVDSKGYTLIKHRDYTINKEVNIDKIPKAAFGDWLELVGTTSDSVLDIARTPTPTITDDSNSSPSADLSIVVTGDTQDSLSPEATQGRNADGSDEEESSNPPKATVTVLAPVRYIKGDPNYDPDADPIGTVLAAPRIGLYLVNSILGIGLVAHVVGSIRRMQYRRQYHMSVMKSKTSDALA